MFLLPFLFIRFISSLFLFIYSFSHFFLVISTPPSIFCSDLLVSFLLSPLTFPVVQLGTFFVLSLFVYAFEDLT